MPPGKKRGTPRRKETGSGRFLLGVGTGIALVCVSLLVYLLLGQPPVAVADKPPVWEPLLTTLPLHQRVRSEAKTPPFAASEEVFESGARLYRTHCAQCHGVPGQASTLGQQMGPRAPQFFAAHERQAAAAQLAGSLFWKTAFGIQHSGMPAYNRVLSNAELWQLRLLLHAAGGSLPDPVTAILVQGKLPQPTAVTP